MRSIVVESMQQSSNSVAAPNYSKNKEVEDISPFLILTLKTVGRDELIVKPVLE